jgi:predicted HicB family RNase H-like nuclease
MIDQYLYSVGWSDEDAVYIARVAEFPSLAAHGDTSQAALREVKKVVRAVLKDLAASKEPVPQPYGKRSFGKRLNVKLPESLHRQLVIEAAQQGLSLNQLITLKLEAPISVTVTIGD